jgi:hypothetical protein
MIANHVRKNLVLRSDSQFGGNIPAQSSREWSAYGPVNQGVRNKCRNMTCTARLSSWQVVPHKKTTLLKDWR